MAEHTHSLTTSEPADAVWEFVRDMDRWAPFLLGYQAHEKQSDRESIWTIKGDVGSLSRTVRFRVQITEWVELERVRFTLEGIGEPMEGDGDFLLEPVDASEAAAVTSAPAKPGLFLRLWAAVVRRLLGRGAAKGSELVHGSKRPAVVRLTFRLGLTPAGTMAPMIDAMIAPVMVATAEDLAQRIVAHLEGREPAADRA